MELDAGFVEEGVDVRAEGKMEREILFEELRAPVCHAKADPFEHAVVLIEVEFEM